MNRAEKILEKIEKREVPTNESFAENDEVVFVSGDKEGMEGIVIEVLDNGNYMVKTGSMTVEVKPEEIKAK